MERQRQYNNAYAKGNTSVENRGRDRHTPTELSLLRFIKERKNHVLFLEADNCKHRSPQHHHVPPTPNRRVAPFMGNKQYLASFERAEAQRVVTFNFFRQFEYAM